MAAPFFCVGKHHDKLKSKLLLETEPKIHRLREVILSDLYMMERAEASGKVKPSFKQMIGRRCTK